jgi:hypothetical protein
MASVDSIFTVIMVIRRDFHPLTHALIVSPCLETLFRYVLILINDIELDLPEYENYETLRAQVLTAITAGSEYFGFA